MKQTISKKYIPLIIGLVLILALLFANKTISRQTSQQSVGNIPSAVTPTNTVSLHDLRITSTYIALLPKFPTIPPPPAKTIAPTEMVLPTATSTLAPPACTFPLAGTTAEEAKPEEYTFSEPQVVVTGIADIIEWLPNNQQVLLTRRLDKLSGHQEIILLNPQSNEIQIYAERESVNEQPVWVDGANAVVYLVKNIINKTSDGKIISPADVRLQLWLSRGDPNQVELIEEKKIITDLLPYLSIASKPGSGQITYRANIDQEFSQRDLSNTPFKVLQSLPFDFSRWEYRKEFRPLSIYDMTWRPNSSQVFLYANGDIGGYTFLFNTNTGKICELNLGAKGNENGWALNARWSSNGKYLAVARTWGIPPIKTSDLAVMDMETGELYTMSLTPPDMEGQHFVIDIAWAPDNLHIAAIAQVIDPNPVPEYRKLSSLYLVDFHANQATQIPSLDIKIGSGPGGVNLAWSGDGKLLLAKCPTAQEGRLCLISVTTSNK